MNETTATTLRAVLKVGGAALTTKGLTTDAGLEAAIGAVITLVGFIWGIISARKAAADAKVVQEIR